MAIGERATDARRAQHRADIALLAVAGLWGVTFVMVKDALAEIGPMTFVAFRFGLAALAMLPFVRGWRPPRSRSSDTTSGTVGGHLLFGGGIVGACLFAGFALQTVGLQFTGAGRAGFITGLSVVIVPIVSALVGRQTIGRAVTAGVALATLGMALLSVGDLASQGLAVTFGDVLVFGCAVSFALHILTLSRFAPRHGVLALTLVQIVTVTLLSGVAAAIWEQPTRAGLLAALPAAVFTGLLCTAVAFAVQTRAQRFTTPTHTALIFSTEPVFAAGFAYWLAGERLGGAELLGCVLILLGMLLAQLAPATSQSRR